MSHKLLKVSLTILCFALFSSAAFCAPARTYDVQVVVFSHITAKTLSCEQWPILSGTALNIGSATPAQSAYGLEPQINALKKNSEYQILFSGSWKETWHGENSSVTIPISNGNNLSGAMTIVLGHYFDVRTNFVFLQPTSTLEKIDTSGYFNRINQSPFGFTFTQNRRMRSNELNYLGKPVMGVLIKILKNPEK